MHEPRSVSVCARCLKPCVSVHVRSPGGSPVCRRSYISSHIFQLLDRGFLAVHASLVNWLHSCQLRAVVRQQNVKSRNENRAVASWSKDTHRSLQMVPWFRISSLISWPRPKDAWLCNPFHGMLATGQGQVTICIFVFVGSQPWKTRIHRESVSGWGGFRLGFVYRCAGRRAVFVPWI